MAHDTIDLGPYRLETEPDRLCRGAEDVALSPKGLGVLAYLARRPGRLVSKDELREQVWGATHVSDTRLRVTVGEIRAALGDDQKNPRYLETVPARGYRFLAPAAGAETGGETGPGGDWPWRDEEEPIVGRRREVEHLLNLFLLARQGRRQIVFLGGEPGIGKTTLVQLFLERLAGQPRIACVGGQCCMHYCAGEAYGPVLEALGRLGQGPRGGVLIKVLERCAPMWLAQLPALVEAAELERLQRQIQGASRERMVRELNDALERLTAESALVLVLEDLHWSDVSTVELLAAIAQRPEPARLLILGTYRPAEAVVQAPALRAAIRELEGRGLCEHVNVELLSRGDVESYLAARLDGAVSKEVVALVFERSGGNALFMVNVLEHLVQARTIHRHEGRWIVDPARAAETRLPRGLRPFIQRRLDALSAEERETLEAASVAGVEFAAATVAHPVTPHDPERVEALLESLAVRSHLIAPGEVVDWPDGRLSARFRFRHALYREGLYEQIPQARRARLHRLVGERLEAAFGPGSPALAAALAVHFEEGRDPERAARYRRLAGERALGRHAYHEAVSHLRAALRAFGKLPAPGRDEETGDRVRWELDVCTALVTTLIATRGYADPAVEEVNLRALALSERLDDPAMHHATLYNLWISRLVAGEVEKGDDLVARMSEIGDETKDGELRLMADCARAQATFFSGELDASRDACRDVLAAYDPQRHGDLARRYGQDDPGVACAAQEAWRLWLAGSPDRAVVQAGEASALAERRGEPYAVALTAFYAIATHQFRGDAATVSRQAEALETVATELGFEVWVPLALALQGWAAAARGDRGGIARLDRGLELYRKTGAGIIVPYLLGLSAETSLRHGRVDAARRHVREALALIEQHGERWWQAELLRLQGEVLLAAEDGDASRVSPGVSFRRALEVARRQGARSLELRAASSLGRLHSRDRRAAAHRRLAELAAGFTEGRDTADLRAARAQLASL